MILSFFRRRAARRAPAQALFGRIAEASRAPELYLEGGVPDSFEGRFESLALHLLLVLRRLRQLPAPADDLGQDLVDACFAYLELGFRQGGISDIAVPKRMKKIGQSFYGRIAAYDSALDAAGEADLAGAIARNIGPSADAAALAAHARRVERAFAGRDLAAILGEEVPFPAFEDREVPHAG